MKRRFSRNILINSKMLPLIEKLSIVITDNFEFFKENEMQDIINSDNKMKVLKNEYKNQPFINDDKLREECGVFGIYNHEDSAALTALGLHALQHRGQEAAGIVTFDGTKFISERHPGLVSDNFTKASVINRLVGNSAVGHNRYSTTGATIQRNIQPFFADLWGGGFAIAHNGNITNALSLRDELIKKGSIFQSTSDTETILQLVARSNSRRTLDRLVDALMQISGAWALVVLTNKKLVGARDPFGIRPLVFRFRWSKNISFRNMCARY